MTKSSHWLNQSEVSFVQQSWDEKSKDILQLKTECDEAKATLKSLQAATENIVKSMLEEVDQHILKQRYPEALQRIKDAEKMQVLPKEVTKRMLELARCYEELDEEIAREPN